MRRETDNDIKQMYLLKVLGTLDIRQVGRRQIGRTAHHFGDFRGESVEHLGRQLAALFGIGREDRERNKG